MKRMRMLIGLVVVAVIIGCAGGCGLTPNQPGANNSPFQPEDTPYTLGIVFDVGPQYRDRVIGSNPTALRYALEVADIYFRDRSEASDRLVLAVVGGGHEHSVLLDTRPRAFKRGFPNREKDVRDYLVKNAEKPGPRRSAYDGVADCFDYLLKMRSGKGKMAVLVYSTMLNDGPDPALSRERLVNSLASYARAGGHSAWYWLTWETHDEMGKVSKDAGLGWVQFIPGPREDPVRPSFLD